MNEVIVTASGRHLLVNQYGNPDHAMKEHLVLSDEQREQMVADSRAFNAAVNEIRDQYRRNVYAHLDQQAEEFVAFGPTEIIEGEQARIAIESVHNIDWSLDEPYPKPEPRQKKRILVIGPENLGASFLVFQRQCEARGIEVVHVQKEEFERRSRPDIFMEEIQSLKAAVGVFAGFPRSGKTYLDHIWVDQALSKGRIDAHDLKAQVGYKVHGSRRGRNIKTDESRKARYSQSKK